MTGDAWHKPSTVMKLKKNQNMRLLICGCIIHMIAELLSIISCQDLCYRLLAAFQEKVFVLPACAYLPNPSLKIRLNMNLLIHYMLDFVYFIHHFYHMVYIVWTYLSIFVFLTLSLFLSLTLSLYFHYLSLSLSLSLSLIFFPFSLLLYFSLLFILPDPQSFTGQFMWLKKFFVSS